MKFLNFIFFTNTTNIWCFYIFYTRQIQDREKQFNCRLPVVQRCDNGKLWPLTCDLQRPLTCTVTKPWQWVVGSRRRQWRGTVRLVSNERMKVDTAVAKAATTSSYLPHFTPPPPPRGEGRAGQGGEGRGGASPNTTFTTTGHRRLLMSLKEETTAGLRRPQTLEPDWPQSVGSRIQATVDDGPYLESWFMKESAWGFTQC